MSEAAEALLELHRARIPTETVALAIDTETTSLHGVVVQVGIVGLDAAAREVCCDALLVAPAPGHTVEPSAERVHGLSDAHVRRHGMDPRRALLRVAEVCCTARARGIPLVAHNASFDAASLRRTAQAIRQPPPVDGSAMVCTMQRSRGLAKRVKARGLFRNAELFEYLCNAKAPPDRDLHDAVADARLTARAYLAGHRRGLW